jgi:glucose-1-phosphate adenylyltransferase
MLRAHAESGADLTVAVRRVNAHETHRFGIVTLGADDRIVEFHEKPRRSRETLASMGIYVFRRDMLIESLQASSALDFGRDVLPALVKQEKLVRAYLFPGYWADVGTVHAYWEANMALMAEEAALNLYNQDWIVHTRSEERAPAKIGPAAQAGGTLISNGCQVNGAVERSVLSPGVFVAEGAVVRDSVILSDTVIEAGAVIDRCVIDKHVVVGANARVGDGDDNSPNVAMPEVLNTGLTLVGEGSEIPEGLVIGRNVVVHPLCKAAAFGKKKRIPSGGNIGEDLR